MSQAATDEPKTPEPKRSNGFRISRRAFLGVSGAAAAVVLAVVLALKRPKLAEPVETQTDSVVAKQDLIPTSCLNCPTRCAILVRKVETTAGKTKVVKISGNSASTYSEGKCCSRSHVGLQVLYNPDRFPHPLVRKAGTEKGRAVDYENDFEEEDWGGALDKIAERLTSPDRLLILQGLNTTSNEDLIRRFALAYGTHNLFNEEGLETDADREGKLLADGRSDSGYEMVSEDGTSTKYILAFSSGIVESERPLARNLRLWGKLRRELPNKTKVVSFDPRYSVTASRADEWLPINPGSEGALAMAIAHVILSEGLHDPDFINDHTEGFNSYSTLARTQRFSPESVSEISGVPADTIRRVAREFAQSKPAVAWSGEAATSWPYGTLASHAIYCLNALVGSIDVPGGIVYQQYPNYEPMPTEGLPITDTGITFREMADRLRDGAIDTAIGFNSNLIMSVPESKEDGKWDKTLKNLFYVHIGPAKSEMAAYADIILPACTYLEDWGYESAIPGSGYAEARIKQPVTEPRDGSRPTARILFDLATRTALPVPFSPVEVTSSEEFAEDFVKYRTAPLMGWDDFREVGVWKSSGSYSYRNYAFGTDSGKFEFHSDHLERLLNVGLPGEGTDYPLKLAIYRPVLEIRSGSQNFPWAQEMYLVMHGRGWRNLVEINRETAHEHGVGEGDEVIIESPYGEIEGEARVVEGMQPGVVAIATGQGHFASGEFADGMGCNPMEVVGTEYDEESGQPSLFDTRVRIRKA
ncbi:MAG TPA: molybdopterin-dependent oxidoreductase [Dehalococcoidia bacterium]|nr:molybdopterin-dependent oxidoreductase [Dehalococcoidia bacterium]